MAGNSSNLHSKLAMNFQQQLQLNNLQQRSDMDEIDDESNSNYEWYHMLLSKERAGTFSGNEYKLLALAGLGYTREEASVAVERCGSDASISVLIDSILAAQVARERGSYLPQENHINGSRNMKNSKFLEEELPNPMIGYGVPCMKSERIRRPLSDRTKGPPFFYYENVALAPKGAWETKTRFLYGIEPEFVDSKYFSATTRKRGSIHNLPIENRFPLLPLPPMNLFEAFPLSKRYWPSWDTRDKMNCTQTPLASAQLIEAVQAELGSYDGTPPESVQKYVLFQCSKWNLIWTGKNKLAQLKPDEMEMLLGYPRNHTRGGGVTTADSIKSLGNSFQVDTVAYHLSVLKEIFPNGMKVLSLFSGIGGAEVALRRLGIKLNFVVSVEKSKMNRDIVRRWWEQSNPSGVLIDLDDAQQVDNEFLGKIIRSIGGFDLVIGRSPCINLTGGNWISSDRLERMESLQFSEYFRILNTVSSFMRSE